MNAVVPVRGGDVSASTSAHRGRPRQHYRRLRRPDRHGHHRRGVGARLLRLRAHAPASSPASRCSRISTQLRLRVAAHPSPRATGGILFALVVAGLALAIWLRPRIDDFGVGSHRPSPSSARRRAISARSSWQLADWGLRLIRSGSSRRLRRRSGARNVMLVPGPHRPRRPGSDPAGAGSEPSRRSGLRLPGEGLGGSAAHGHRRPNRLTAVNAGESSRAAL